MQAGLKFNIQTLGCKLNFSESSEIGRLLEEAGNARVDASDLFDILVLNTCSVTENADKKCRSIIRKAKKDNPDVFVIVIGCYAQLKPEEIASIDGVNLVLGASDKFGINQHLENYFGKSGTVIKGGPVRHVLDFVPSYSAGDRTRSFLKVQDGCDYFCTFCTIPLARGRSRSPRISELLDQVKTIESLGIREIVLTGVNIGDFGAGGDENFLSLIRQLDVTGNINRYRISSIEPNLLSDEIIEFVAVSKRFVPHFHIPLQSGSDEILKSMRRRYDTKLYRSRIQKIKELMPSACIGVDVITGYPGETEQHFKETCDFLLDLGVSYLHVFTYSERANTSAPKKDGFIPVDVRRQRSRKLQEISRKMKRAFYQSFIGQEMEVLFEKNEDDLISGFTPNYIRVQVPAGCVEENSLKMIRLSKMNADDVMISEHQEKLIEAPV